MRVRGLGFAQHLLPLNMFAVSQNSLNVQNKQHQFATDVNERLIQALLALRVLLYALFNFLAARMGQAPGPPFFFEILACEKVWNIHILSPLL